MRRSRAGVAMRTIWPQGSTCRSSSRSGPGPGGLWRRIRDAGRCKSRVVHDDNRGDSRNSGGPPNAAMQKSLLIYGICVRAHGMPGFPDPQASGGWPNSARNHENSRSMRPGNKTAGPTQLPRTSSKALPR
jgi:hypothetical protein